MLVVATLARTVAWNVGAHAGDSRYAFYSPFTHADGLLSGCLLGELYTWNRLPATGPLRRLVRAAAVPALAVALAFLFVVSSDSAFLYEGGFTLAVVACAVVVLAALDDDAPLFPFRLLDLRPLRYVGEISYGLYIWNPVFLFNYPGSALNAVLGTALTFGVAAASFRWIEAPALRLKSRFAPVAHQAEVVVEPAAPGPTRSAQARPSDEPPGSATAHPLSSDRRASSR
jgi:peptidoglycan/LPS O-acetylase OafA/YrhL